MTGDSVGVRELRQNASKVLDRVKAGEVVQVKERGRPVARICPEPDNEWDALIESGTIRPASGESSLADITPVTGAIEGSDILRELRETER